MRCLSILFCVTPGIRRTKNEVQDIRFELAQCFGLDDVVETSVKHPDAIGGMSFASNTVGFGFQLRHSTIAGRLMTPEIHLQPYAHDVPEV
jgi:hypothetical protein